MLRKPASKRTRPKPKAVLRLPDLDQAKSAVLNSLTSADAQRGYRHAIDEFLEWYCSEPRLSFSRTVVLRYRIYLEARHLAPGTINLRLGAVRRLAYEAADCGLLSPDLAAGISTSEGRQENRRKARQLAHRRTRSTHSNGSILRRKIPTRIFNTYRSIQRSAPCASIHATPNYCARSASRNSVSDRGSC